jgi:hypothetical protein
LRERCLSLRDYDLSGIKLLNLRKIEVNVTHLTQYGLNLGKLKTIPRYEENVL